MNIPHNNSRSELNKDNQTSHKFSTEQGEELYNQVKDKANEMYEEGKKRLCEAQDSIKEYSDELVKTIHQKPLTSLLVAGGIGFILAALLKK